MSQSASTYTIEVLARHHDRAAFRCGTEALDRYIARVASQDVARRASAVFILTPDRKTIAGFYTLCAHSILLKSFPGKFARELPRYPDVPVTLLGRMAVACQFRGQRLGEQLLFDALRRSLMASRSVASAAVAVDPKDDAAAGFYARYGFIPLSSQEDRLYYPMATVEKMFPEEVRT